MGQKIVVGPLNKGLRNDVLPFNVDNDSFPTLINAYQWRGRIKRKRGTSTLGRLNRYLGTTDGSGNFTTTIIPFPLENAISQFVVGSQLFTDGDLSSTNPTDLITVGPGIGELDRETGVLEITGSNADTPVYYYPGLPVLGLEPFVADPGFLPQQVAFDTTYSYNVPLNGGNFYNVSFYNNPMSETINGIPYTQKGVWTPLNWNLEDYQQIWTTNYSGAMWAIPGVNATVNPTTAIGMQFKPIYTITYVDLHTMTIVIQESTQTLVIGDWVFINEVSGTNNQRLNLQTGFIFNAVFDSMAATNTLTVKFPYANIDDQTYSGGILQYLTNTANSEVDCIRWYNGSMTDFPSSLIPNEENLGWVNFSPPITSNNTGNFSVADLPATATPYYLVGARAVVPFKDRLIFFGPIVQLSSPSFTPIYLPDTIIYSQNGYPYYTTSFDASTNAPPSPLVQYNPLVVPTNQNASVTSWWENITGFGGFLNAGYSRPITSVSINEDALIVGFSDRQTRLLYTGNDIVPFNFYVINSELGSDATFSSITLDRGVITFGGRGIVLTSQIASQRIDLEIPDQIFQLPGTTASVRSICAQRDFINEWIQFTYPSNLNDWAFPNQTLQYNYRDASWAIFNESYTTYGTIRVQNGLTWGTVGDTYPTWAQWNVPWDSGTDTIGQPLIYAGNAQGYVVFKGEGTEEAPSLFIQNIVQFGGVTTIVSPNHCLNDGDYITINGATGSLATYLNQKIFQVDLVETDDGFDPDEFNITVAQTGSYLGGASIVRMYVPFIQTRQFPISWDMARKTRLGPQQYLLTSTPNGQITLLIFLSQNSSNAYNDPNYPYPIVLVPNPDSENNGLIYSVTLYTCPESTNLGLTAANTNLQMLTANQQQQIWHRMNTSLIGDTVQIGFTMDNAQMLDLTFSNQFEEIELHSFILDVQPSQVLA